MESSVNTTEKQENKQAEATTEQLKTNEDVVQGAQAESQATAKTEVLEELDPQEAQALMEEGSKQIERPINYNLGDRVKGTLSEIGKQDAFINIGQKSEATISLDDLKDKEGNLPKIGDEIEAYVINMSNGTIELGKHLPQKMEQKIALTEAFENKIPIEGEVTGINKGGFDVQVFGKRAFCPISHIELHYCKNPKQYLGKKLTFTILELKNNGKQIVLSRREILRKEQEAAAKLIQDKLVEGAEFEGKVSSLTNYGAFVDLGSGVEGLVHVSEISHKRVDNPEDVLKIGDTVRVKVLKYNPDEKRISLSIKALETDPWESALEQFPPDTIVSGKVVRIEDFGAFVELAPGIDGLIHISEISHKRVRHPSEALKIGEEVNVKVLHNDPEQRRIGLSMKELEETPVELPKENNRKRNRSKSRQDEEFSMPNPPQKVFGTLGDLLQNIQLKK